MNRQQRRAEAARRKRLAKKRRLAPDAMLRIEKAMVELRASVDRDVQANLLYESGGYSGVVTVAGWRIALNYDIASETYELGAQMAPVGRQRHSRDSDHLGIALEGVQKIGEPRPTPVTPPNAPAGSVHRFQWKRVSSKAKPAVPTSKTSAAPARPAASAGGPAPAGARQRRTQAR